MKHTTWTRAAATAVLALTVPLAACNDSEGQEAETPPSSASNAPTESPSDPPDDAPTTDAPEPQSNVLTLDESAEVSPEGPTWSFPVRVDGWELGTFDQQGVNQLTKDGGQSLFTTYQLRAERSGSDADDGRAHLQAYLDTFLAQDGVESTTDPTWSTTTLPGLPSEVEFVQQEFSYTTSEGTYRSRYLARPLGDYLLAVQYAAPADRWSEEEWQALVDGGLRVML